MKIIVCGGRDYMDYDTIANALDDLHAETPITKLIHGAMRGADELAEQWAECKGIPVKRYDANFELFRRDAGRMRNRKMLDVENPDLVVAFVNSRERGTYDMCLAATSKGYRIWHVMPATKEPKPKHRVRRAMG